MLPLIGASILISFAISWVTTLFMRRLAVRLDFVDKPGGRKAHTRVTPLGGGVAIFLGIMLPLAAGVLYAWLAPSSGEPWVHYLGGVRMKTRLAGGIALAMLIIHVLGLWDDRRALGPMVKLVVQLAVSAMLVLVFDLRALTTAGPVISAILTILWITAITNAFNFLDNMDGLSAGVAAVCTIAFLITAVLIHQWFVAGMLAILLGSLLGFLCFNFPPASVFMGDSGSMLIGLVLGVLTVRTTFLPPDVQWGAGWYAVFAPLIVLALPLYDLVVVSTIRLLRGKSPFVGDTNHFSHRLVARGMSRRTAVLCLYLVTAATAVAAIVLPHVPDTFTAMLIVVQTLLILGVVALLEQHPLPPNDRR